MRYTTDFVLQVPPSSNIPLENMTTWQSGESDRYDQMAIMLQKNTVPLSIQGFTQCLLVQKESGGLRPVMN